MGLPTSHLPHFDEDSHTAISERWKDQEWTIRTRIIDGIGILRRVLLKPTKTRKILEYIGLKVKVLKTCCELASQPNDH